MSSVQPTSLEAFLKIQEDGTAETQRDQVLEVLRQASEPLTNREIATALGLEPSTVSARRNELIKMGLVRQVGRRKCRVSGFTALTWALKEVAK